MYIIKSTTFCVSGQNMITFVHKSTPRKKIEDFFSSVSKRHSHANSYYLQARIDYLQAQIFRLITVAQKVPNGGKEMYEDQITRLRAKLSQCREHLESARRQKNVKKRSSIILEM